MNIIIKTLIVVLLGVLFYKTFEKFQDELPRCEKICFQERQEKKCNTKKVRCVDKDDNVLTSVCNWNDEKKNCYF